MGGVGKSAPTPFPFGIMHLERKRGRCWWILAPKRDGEVRKSLINRYIYRRDIFYPSKTDFYQHLGMTRGHPSGRRGHIPWQVCGLLKRRHSGPWPSVVACAERKQKKVWTF